MHNLCFLYLFISLFKFTKSIITRKIIHIDMDAFFASVEQYDNPTLRGKEVVVGGLGPRGVIAAASYEARKYGVRSAMPSYKARSLCPHLIFVKPRFDRYKEVSSQIRSVFQEYTDKIEPLSLDEAYLDITENKKGITSAIQIAREIKQKIKQVTGLTASAGVSVNKFLAKVASDIHKPDGLSVILPDDVQDFIDELPIEKFYGVGKATLQKMKRKNIHTGRELRAKSELELVQWFGKFGRYLYKVSRGQDDREVESNRIRKSISVERTYETDLVDSKIIRDKVGKLSQMLAKAMSKKNLNGRTVVLKIRYSDFTSFTRSRSATHFFNDEPSIFQIAEQLLTSIPSESIQPIRLLGLGMNNLDSEVSQLQLTLSF